MSHHEHSSSHGHDHELGHIVPMSVYVSVLAALIILTVVTVLVAKFVDFGHWNFPVAMLVASIKAGLVALFFMHLKYEHPVTWLYAFFPILLLGFFLTGVFLDNPFRQDGKTGKIPAHIDAPLKTPEAHH
jgi:cytochrome c oxidase subunit 4